MRGLVIDPLRAAEYRIGEDRVAFFSGAVESEPDHFYRLAPVIRSTPLAVHLLSVSPHGNLIGYSD